MKPKPTTETMDEQKIATLPAGIAVVDASSCSALTKENEPDILPISKENSTQPSNNCIETSNECGDGVGSSVSPASSTCSFTDSTNEEDAKSCSSSGKDSGVGKTVSESTGNNSRRNSGGSHLHHKEGSCNNTKVKANSGTATGGGGGPDSQLELDASFLWGASLLYYTGISAPRVKEHHFITSPSPPSSSSRRSPKASSSFASTFSLFRARSTTKLFRSSWSLRSSEDSAAMEESHPSKSPWRFGGGSSTAKKFKTLPSKKSASPVALDSPFGAGGAMSTPDSGFSSGTGGESSGGGKMVSPLRRRHASCSSTTTPTGSTSALSSAGGGGGGLRGKIKNNTNSLRLLKNVTSRPSLLQFLDKSSSNSLPRSPRKNRICEEMAAAQQAAEAEASSSSLATTTSPVSEQKATSGLKSAKRALRNSFKAARNLLPGGSSSKIGPASSTSSVKASLRSSRDKLCMFPSPFNENETSNSKSTQNSSAPNTPVVGKKSRLERAKKRFASTLSLHTGGGGSSSSNNGSSTGGYPPGRSKSASTLVISDSEPISGGISSGIVSYHRHHRQHSERTASCSTEESCDVLAVVDGDHSNAEAVVLTTGASKNKNKSADNSGSGSKSPFRFIGRSKANKEKKSGSHPSGFHAQPDPYKQEEEHQGIGKVVVVLPKAQPSPEANIELLPECVQGKLSAVAAEKEKPSKKRMSLVKALGKTILRGSSSGSGADNKKTDDDGSRQETSKKETVIFYKSSSGGNLSDSETRKSTRRGFQEAGSQEIVTFDNEPRVRTPRTGRRQRLNSGSGTSGSTASSSVTYTPPPSATASLPSPSTPEKDCEIQEVEVSETSIDITTPVKSLQHLQQQKQPRFSYSHYRANKGVAEHDTFNGYDGVAGAVGSHVSRESGSNNNSNPVPSSSNTPSKASKKIKSPSLITRVVSLSTSSRVADKNMEDAAGGSGKKKRKGLKKSNSKKGHEDTVIASKEPDQSSSSLPADAGESAGNSSGNQGSSTSSGAAAAATVVNNNNGDSIPTAARRRKSSEDYKDLRKNGRHSTNENIFIRSTEEPLQKSGESRKRDGKDDDDDIVSEDGGDNNEVDETDDPETACTASFRQLMPFNYDLEPVEEGKKERLYKVLVVGELGAGKTSIIKRYVHQFFSQHYRATIGVDFALKVLRWDPDTVVRLQLWDIAGQERFGSMTRVYYKEAVGAFVVFDVTRSATLEAVPKWKADLDAKVALPDGRPIPTVLLANKSDQPKEGIAANREKMNEFCQQQGFSAWFETSAKDNINIDESANFLVSKILEMDKWSQEPLAVDPDKVELTANGKHKGSSASNCAC